MRGYSNKVLAESSDDRNPVFKIMKFTILEKQHFVQNLKKADVTPVTRKNSKFSGNLETCEEVSYCFINFRKNNTETTVDLCK